MSKLTANHVLTIAKGQVGVREVRNNRTKYGKWYGMNGSPWCGMFVSWCFREDLKAIYGKFARTDAKAKSLHAKELFHHGTVDLKKGDVVFFHLGNPHRAGRWNGISHTGICAGKNKDGRFIVIEGNTSGKVAIRYRASSSIAGFFRPKYAAPAPIKPKPVPVKPVPKPVKPKPPMKAKVYNKGGLNLRKGAGTKYPIITWMKNGTPLVILGSANLLWYKIKLGTKVGYAAKRFVKKV